jgi:hypothetical protein
LWNHARFGGGWVHRWDDGGFLSLPGGLKLKEALVVAEEPTSPIDLNLPDEHADRGCG